MKTSKTSCSQILSKEHEMKLMGMLNARLRKRTREED